MRLSLGYSLEWCEAVLLRKAVGWYPWVPVQVLDNSEAAGIGGE